MFKKVFNSSFALYVIGLCWWYLLIDILLTYFVNTNNMAAKSLPVTFLGNDWKQLILRANYFELILILKLRSPVLMIKINDNKGIFVRPFANFWTVNHNTGSPQGNQSSELFIRWPSLFIFSLYSVFFFFLVNVTKMH